MSVSPSTNRWKLAGRKSDQVWANGFCRKWSDTLQGRSPGRDRPWGCSSEEMRRPLVKSARNSRSLLRQRFHSEGCRPMPTHERREPGCAAVVDRDGGRRCWGAPDPPWQPRGSRVTQPSCAIVLAADGPCFLALSRCSRAVPRDENRCSFVGAAAASIAPADLRDAPASRRRPAGAPHAAPLGGFPKIVG